MGKVGDESGRGDNRLTSASELTLLPGKFRAKASAAIVLVPMVEQIFNDPELPISIYFSRNHQLAEFVQIIRENNRLLVVNQFNRIVPRQDDLDQRSWRVGENCVALEDGLTTTVGRTMIELNLSIGTSRGHVKVTVDGNIFSFTDLNSKNGTSLRFGEIIRNPRVPTQSER